MRVRNVIFRFVVFESKVACEIDSLVNSPLSDKIGSGISRIFNRNSKIKNDMAVEFLPVMISQFLDI